MCNISSKQLNNQPKQGRHIMAKIEIKDLAIDKELSSKAMTEVMGGFKIFGWEFSSTSTGDGTGYRYGCWTHDDGRQWCTIY
jgi:hypothetical protein